MAKRVSLSDDSKWVKDTPEVIEFTTEQLAEEGNPSTPLLLTKNIIFKSVGAATGVEYIWSGAGSVVYVDDRDVPGFMNRPIRKSCCGSISTPYFVMLEG